MKHIPVLLRETINCLEIKATGKYLDCTAGFGGHSNKILELLNNEGELFLIDMDKEAIEFLKEKYKNRNNVHIFHTNYKDFSYKKRFDGILLDLGISSYQIDSDKRGFSFRYNTPLDMRMNRDSNFNIVDWIKKHSIEDLAEILENYSDERDSLNIAKSIKKMADNNKLKTTYDLKHAIIEGKKNKGVKYSLRRVFQALRILTNNEMNNLESFLKKSPSLLNTNGIIAVITYHSIEDRLVKYFFKNNDDFQLINKKVIKPKYEEIMRNKRARSAKLRCARKI